MRIAWLLPAVVCLAVAPAMAQDPVKVDSKHYKVEFENAEVRVLGITYHFKAAKSLVRLSLASPKSIMHFGL